MNDYDPHAKQHHDDSPARELVTPYEVKEDVDEIINEFKLTDGKGAYYEADCFTVGLYEPFVTALKKLISDYECEFDFIEIPPTKSPKILAAEKPFHVKMDGVIGINIKMALKYGAYDDGNNLPIVDFLDNVQDLRDWILNVWEFLDEIDGCEFDEL